MTHTYSLLEVDQAVYAQVADKLRSVGYGHAISDTGEIDMQGIALIPLRGQGIPEKLFEHRGDGTVWGKLPDGRYVELVEKRAGDLHCSTCQCPKLHAEAPVPGNPRSRSWHQNALTEKPR